MSFYVVWMFLRSVFGNPWIALIIIALVGWWLGRRVFFRSRPERYWARRQRAAVLRRQIAVQDWNRPARLELADWLRERRQYKEAVALLKPNLDWGDDDDDTLFVMGVASYGAGDVAEGERLLRKVAERSPKFKNGDVFLELGRHRLTNGNIAGAIEALETFVGQRRSTVEGRTLLAMAYAKRGDDAKAKAMRDAAWVAYTEAPRFLRRQERFWAYRAKPARGAVWLGVGVAIAVVVVIGLAQLFGALTSHRSFAGAYDEYDEYGEYLPRRVEHCPLVQPNDFIGRYALDAQMLLDEVRRQYPEAAAQAPPDFGGEARDRVMYEITADRMVVAGAIDVCFAKVGTVSHDVFTFEGSMPFGAGGAMQTVQVRVTRAGDHFSVDYGGGGAGVAQSANLIRVD